MNADSLASSTDSGTPSASRQRIRRDSTASCITNNSSNASLLRAVV